MPTQCIISFDHPNFVYYSGDSLNGNVQLITNNPKSIRGIHITINGYGNTFWVDKKREHRDGKYVDVEVHCTGSQQYLNSRFYVIGSEHGGSFDLAPGIYNYPFSTLLPSDLPSSMNEECGNIQYEVEVTIVRALRFDNIFKQGFTVEQSLNLNSNPDYQLEKTDFDDTVNFCCICCFWCCGRRGKARTVCKIPKNGYVSGERIHYTVSVDNRDSNNVNSGVVKLLRKTTFTSTSPNRDHKRIDHTLVDKPIAFEVSKQSQLEFVDFIDVPFTQPTTIARNSIIEVQYYLQVQTYGGCCDATATIQLPITIGTIAIGSGGPTLNEPYSNTIGSQQPMLPSGQHYPSLPPTETGGFNMPHFQNSPYQAPLAQPNFGQNYFDPALNANSIKLTPALPNNFGVQNIPAPMNYPTSNMNPTGNYPEVEVGSSMEWFKISAKRLQQNLPPSAFLAGYHHSDEMYIGRARHEDDLLPAKLIPKKLAAYISYGGKELQKEEFEVLLGNQFTWIPCRNGEVPPDAVDACETRNGEKLYIARAIHNGTHNIGKVLQSHKCCYIPSDGLEVQIFEYEVLTLQ